MDLSSNYQYSLFPKLFFHRGRSPPLPEINLVCIESRNRGVVVKLCNHLTGDTKVVGSIPGTALMSFIKAFYLHCFSIHRVPCRMIKAYHIPSQGPYAEMPTVPFLQYLVLFFVKNTAGFMENTVFPQIILLHMSIAER